MKELIDKLGSALHNLMLLVHYESDLPQGARNGVTDSSGIMDEGITRAAEIIAEAREAVRLYKEYLNANSSNDVVRG